MTSGSRSGAPGARVIERDGDHRGGNAYCDRADHERETHRAAHPPFQLTYMDARALYASAIPVRSVMMYRSSMVASPGRSGQRPVGVDVRVTTADFFRRARDAAMSSWRESTGSFPTCNRAASSRRWRPTMSQRRSRAPTMGKLHRPGGGGSSRAARDGDRHHRPCCVHSGRSSQAARYLARHRRLQAREHPGSSPEALLASQGPPA